MPIKYLSSTDEDLFSYVNLVLPAWILLILLPRWKVTPLVVNATVGGFCIMYALLMATQLTGEAQTLSFQDMLSYEGVAKLFTTRAMVLPCWVHFAAFDLFTARWIALDSIKKNVPTLLVAPVQLLTMFMGPVGLLAYAVLRTVASRKPAAKGSKSKAA
ncbi:MAG: hypothetical protein WDW38_006771 [Sanguina aurantia]